MNKRYNRGILFCLLIAVLMLCGCTSTEIQSEDMSQQTFAMGTVFDMRVIGQGPEVKLNVLSRSLAETDQLISYRKKDSVPDAFNTMGQADISEIKDLIEMTLDVSDRSEGAFDPTVLPVSVLWGFDRMQEADYDVSEMKVPDSEDIEEAVLKVDHSALKIEENLLVSQKPDLKIELGAIGKGYAIDRAVDLVMDETTDGLLISAGSSVCAIGHKADGSLFRVALRDPREDEENPQPLGILTITDACIATSGDYERVFFADGRRYHHILDPRTGFPSDSGLMQVTIIGTNNALCDALSTACFVLGLDAGMKLADTYNVTAIFVDEDKNVWFNQENVLDMLDFIGSESGYSLQIYDR